MQKDNSNRSFPLFKRNLRMEEAYKRYEDRQKQFFFERKYTRKDLLWAMTVFLLLLSIPVVTLSLSKTSKNLTASAGPEGADVIAVEAEEMNASGPISRDKSASASKGRLMEFGPGGYLIDVSDCPEIGNRNGLLSVNINIPSDAQYYFWARIMATDEINNSFYLKIDGGCPFVAGDFPAAAGTWEWINIRDGNFQDVIRMTLSAGQHTLVFSGREAGVKIDKFLLTTDPLCTPIITGINCSGQKS